MTDQSNPQASAVPPLRLRASGYVGPTTITDRYALGPSEHVDPELVTLLAEMAFALYACAAALRTAQRPPDDPMFALHEILTASVAIAATEAEALASLCSIDLCAPARINARALGELAKRVVLLEPDLAKRMYDAADASRRQLFRTAPTGHWARGAIEAAFANIDETTMEKLERGAYARATSIRQLMDAFESRYYSKWNHADIIALAEAGERLLKAGEQVRTTIAVDPHADFMLYRASGWVRAILITVEALFGTNLGDRLDDFKRRHESHNERFNAEFAEINARQQARTSREHDGQQ